MADHPFLVIDLDGNRDIGFLGDDRDAVAFTVQLTSIDLDDWPLTPHDNRSFKSVILTDYKPHDSYVGDNDEL